MALDWQSGETGGLEGRWGKERWKTGVYNSTPD